MGATPVRFAHPAPRSIGALFAALALSAPVAAAADRSQTHYVLHCSGCHQLDGSGSAASSIPDLRGQLGLYLHTSAGREFLLQVPGSANSPLSDAELAALLNWMLAAFSREQVPAGVEPYTAAEVARHRRRTPADVSGRRRAVVQELRKLGHAIY